MDKAQVVKNSYVKTMLNTIDRPVLHNTFSTDNTFVNYTTVLYETGLQDW